jgi:hypothetical protein
MPYKYDATVVKDIQGNTYRCGIQQKKSFLKKTDLFRYSMEYKPVQYSSLWFFHSCGRWQLTQEEAVQGGLAALEKMKNKGSYKAKTITFL